MSFLLDCAYLGASLAAAPYLVFKALTSEKYRTGFPERFGRLEPRRGERPCLWLHAVSVGEMNLARTLIEAVKTNYPNWDLVVSTATNTGLATAAKLYPETRAFYFPLDFSWMVRRALARIRPDVVVLVELEVWPNFLAEASRRGARIAVVNARVSDRSFPRYRVLRPLVRRWLGRVDLFCAQDRTYADRLVALGAPPERVVVSGNLKYDTAAPSSEACDPEFARGFGLKGDEPVVVGGCTWPGEDEALLDAYERLRGEFPGLRLILAPRQAERFEAVERLVRERGLAVVRRTALAGGAEGGEAVVVLDTVGELARVYGLARVVFVGGSLIPRGGHNILEAAGLGKAVLFGPHTENFRQVARALLDEGAARRVADATELETALHELLAHPRLAAEMGGRARAIVERNRGATTRTIQALKPLLEKKQTEGREGP